MLLVGNIVFISETRSNTKFGLMEENLEDKLLYINRTKIQHMLCKFSENGNEDMLSMRIND